LVIATGGLVFLASLGEHENLAVAFARRPLNVAVVALATLLFVVLWFLVSKRRSLLARIVAAGQMALIPLGWYLLYAPNALLTAAGPLSFHETAAPPATLRQLMIALVVGCALIFPGLYYLLRVFKLPGSTGGGNR
jgi:cytochrome d ubiquinol oxidase subunit II